MTNLFKFLMIIVHNYFYIYFFLFSSRLSVFCTWKRQSSVYVVMTLHFPIHTNHFIYLTNGDALKVLKNSSIFDWIWNYKKTIISHLCDLSNNAWFEDMIMTKSLFMNFFCTLLRSRNKIFYKLCKLIKINVIL